MKKRWLKKKMGDENGSREQRTNEPKAYTLKNKGW